MEITQVKCIDDIKNIQKIEYDGTDYSLIKTEIINCFLGISENLYNRPKVFMYLSETDSYSELPEMLKK